MSNTPNLMEELQGKLDGHLVEDGPEEVEVELRDFIGVFLGPRVFAKTMKKSETYNGQNGKKKQSLDQLGTLQPTLHSHVHQWLTEQGFGDDLTLDTLRDALNHVTKDFGDPEKWDPDEMYAKLGKVGSKMVLRIKGKKKAKGPRLTYHTDYILSDGKKSKQDTEEQEDKVPTKEVTGAAKFEEFSLVALTPKHIEDWFSDEAFAAVQEAADGKGIHVKLQAEIEQTRTGHALTIDSAISRDIKLWGEQLNETITQRVDEHLAKLNHQKNKVVTNEFIQERAVVLDAILDELDQAKIAAEYEEGIYEIFERHQVSKDFRRSWVVKTIFKTTVNSLKVATACIRLGVSGGTDAAAWVSLALAIKSLAETVVDARKDEAKTRAELLDAVVEMKKVYDSNSSVTKVKEWLASKKGMSTQDKLVDKRARHLASLGKLQANLRKLASAIRKNKKKLQSLQRPQLAVAGEYLAASKRLDEKYRPISKSFAEEYDFVKLHVDQALEKMDVPLEYTTIIGRLEATLKGGSATITLQDVKSVALDGKQLYSTVKSFAEAIASV